MAPRRLGVGRHNGGVFTGLVEQVGVIGEVAAAPGCRLLVSGADLLAELSPGDSLSVSGVCLTVAAVAVSDRNSPALWCDVMGETLNRTTLGGLAVGDRVNLERSLTLASPLGGHLVQGHIDGVGEVCGRTDHRDWRVLRVSVPPGLMPLLVEKGSVALSGVSLTISARSPDPDCWCEVSLIPTTLAGTTLGSLEVGDRVNIEVDLIAKYVQSLLARQGLGLAVAVPPTPPPAGVDPSPPAGVDP